MVTDTYAIEAYMKQCLDRNFWSFDTEGRIVWHRVSEDFIPQFKRYTWSDADADQERAQYVRRDWTMHDFRKIEKARIKGKSWKEIGRSFAASDNATSDFYKRVIRQQDENLTKQIKARRIKIIQWMYHHNVRPVSICLYMNYSQALVESITGRIEK